MKAPFDALPFPDNLIAQAHCDVDAERKAKNLPPIDWDKQSAKLMERRKQNQQSRRAHTLKRMAAAAGRILG